MSENAASPVIVVGFDGSDESLAALHWAGAEARSRGARLRVVTAWDPNPVTPWTLPLVAEWRAQARTEAERAARLARLAVGGGLDVDAVAPEGAAGPVLVRESSDADLLVIGSAGHVGLAGLLAGSVSRYCLHRTRCPLVVLGPGARSDSTRRVVLSSTLDPAGETYDWVARWVIRRPVPVHVVASYELTDPVLVLDAANVEREVHRQNDEWVAGLHRAVADRAGHPPAVTSVVVRGNTQAVLEHEMQAGDLLVVPSGCEHFVPVADGPSPIAVVPAPHVSATPAGVR